MDVFCNLAVVRLVFADPCQRCELRKRRFAKLIALTFVASSTILVHKSVAANLFYK